MTWRRRWWVRLFPQRGGRLRQLLDRNRVLWSVALAACLALTVGLIAGRMLAPAVAETAEAGLITAPVAWGELHSELVLRMDVAYADPIEVMIDTADGGSGIVTGRIPATGSELAALSVALEVGGRPLIVLPGEVPAYRALRVGMSGPDVVQLKTALRAVGLDGGDPANDAFDEVTAAAVAALYEQVGYSVPAGEEEAEEDVRLAEDTVREAEQSLTLARHELGVARAGASRSEIVAADNAVTAAQRELDAAQRATPDDEVLLAGLRDALSLAQVQRQELSEPADVEALVIAVSSAEHSLSSARESLARARNDALPVLPAAEILYLSDLPRRVDAVAAVHGAALTGPALTVSGAALTVTGSLPEADAQLLVSGSEAFLELPDGTEHRAVVDAVAPPEGEDATGWSVRLLPDPLTPEAEQQLRGQSLRVRIPVGSTEGEVLSVPAAALTSGSGGETRVEVVEGDPREGERAEVRLVVVETGLATADGVEIRPVEGELDEGDIVVVGR